jgi:hypothetical protein
MTEIKPCTPRAKRLVTALVKAADEHAFSGSYPPEDHEEIEDRFVGARASLENYIAKLEAAAPGAAEKARADQQYAVKFKGNPALWRIARKVPVSDYGPQMGSSPDAQVWCEVPSTAYLAEVGQEEIAIPLPDRA